MNTKKQNPNSKVGIGEREILKKEKGVPLEALEKACPDRLAGGPMQGSSQRRPLGRRVVVVMRHWKPLPQSCPCPLPPHSSSTHLSLSLSLSLHVYAITRKQGLYIQEEILCGCFQCRGQMVSCFPLDVSSSFSDLKAPFHLPFLVDLQVQQGFSFSFKLEKKFPQPKTSPITLNSHVSNVQDDIRT